jgi:FlaA1/EpsC-like NDP-sugar epimerase
MDVARAIAPSCRTEIIGIRPGEKLHEEMITETDALNTIDLGDRYVILPTISYANSKEKYLEHHKATAVPAGFRYNSGTNTQWETIESLREEILRHCDPAFKPL